MCAEIIRTTRATYLAKLKEDMSKLPRGSKRWWSLNKQLLHRQAAPSFFPPLKDGHGHWHRDPVGKANLLDDVLQKKSQLPPETTEHFFATVADEMSNWFPIRPRQVRRLLEKLRIDQATGPDGFPARFLKRLARYLCLPIALIARRIFSEARWPDAWRLHFIVPLFKRGSVSKPGQYRGIHLSSIVAKTVERTIALPLVTFLEKHGYGKPQWAFRKGSAARDLVTVYVAKWVLCICQGLKVGLYLSDISGAFDKVSRHLLMGKLSQIGLPASFLDFLNSYLMHREGKVTVEGAFSTSMHMCDMVFQGTVLGPPLWNSFFADVIHHVPEGQQEINLFADDLTVMTSVSQNHSNDLLLETLSEIQVRTHAWGARNQVEFDPGKEYFKIIHPALGQGEDWKLLGTLLDSRLSMKPCIEMLLSKLRPKIRALCRLQHMYSVKQMLNLFKAHIWSILEYSNGALILACETQLKRLDSMQRGFLREMGLTDTEAFVTYNFAPPSMRRSIGLLGFLHKRTLRECHPLIIDLLPLAVDRGVSGDFHTKALYSYSGGVSNNRRLYERSLFRYIHMYNRLPQVLADAASVKELQSKLTHIAKVRAMRDEEDWRQVYQDQGHFIQTLYG